MRATLALWVGVVLALAGLGYLYTHSQTQVDRLELQLAQQITLTEQARKASIQAQERLKSERKVLVAREAKIASQARKFTQAQEALKTALQAEKEWNDTEVPTAVREALLQASDGRHGPSDSADSGGLRNADP